MFCQATSDSYQRSPCESKPAPQSLRDSSMRNKNPPDKFRNPSSTEQKLILDVGAKWQRPVSSTSSCSLASRGELTSQKVKHATPTGSQTKKLFLHLHLACKESLHQKHWGQVSMTHDSFTSQSFFPLSRASFLCCTDQSLTSAPMQIGTNTSLCKKCTSQIPHLRAMGQAMHCVKNGIADCQWFSPILAPHFLLVLKHQPICSHDSTSSPKSASPPSCSPSMASSLIAGASYKFHT